MAEKGVNAFMKGLLNNTCSARLKQLIGSRAFILEAFVMDDQGAMVGLTNKTSDYWQGDEAKFTESYKGGAGAVHYGNNDVKASLEEALDEARSLAKIFEAAGVLDNLDLSRRQANDILRYYIEHSPSFLGVYVAFEPQAFDGKDDNFIDEWGHDLTGRFIPCWTRKGKQSRRRLTAGWSIQGRAKPSLFFPPMLDKAYPDSLSFCPRVLIGSGTRF